MLILACAGGKDAVGKRRVDTLAVATANTPGNAAVEPACGTDQFIGDEGIGALSIGAPLDTVRALCKVVRDTIVQADEGMTARKVTVVFPVASVVAEIVDNRVWRVEVSSPHFRTRDSLGVGTPLERLLKLEDPRGASGEGRYYVLSPGHCGLSFRLSDGWPATVRHPVDRAKLSLLPHSIAVSQVLITGCRND